MLLVEHILVKREWLYCILIILINKNVFFSYPNYTFASNSIFMHLKKKNLQYCTFLLNEHHFESSANASAKAIGVTICKYYEKCTMRLTCIEIGVVILVDIIGQ